MAQHCRDHVVVFLTIDDRHYQVDVDCIPPDGDADEFWIAKDVREMESNTFWALDNPPMGSTPGECLDAVIKEARR